MIHTIQNDTKHSDFHGLGISPSILKVLEKLHLETPTPIQWKSIPVAIRGEDLIGIAQTGTGKTFAFGIPMLQRLGIHKGRGLVLLPTRELALQVDENLKKLGGSFGLRTAALIGGEPIGKQIQLLKKNPHIVVATPGRLNDCLERRLLKLDEVKVLVLDEADMMLDMGFMPQVRQILKYVPKERQTMLFSATMPAAISKLAEEYMSLPVNIEVAPSGTTAELVDQEMYVVNKEDRLMHLEKILKEYRGQVLVFTRTKHFAKTLTRRIEQMGHRAAEIHSNRSLVQRRQALDGFKSKKYRVLVATDIAARGIDVSGIELVVNYDLPDDSGDYVHRIGRTARAGTSGKAISFALPTQWKEVRSIERLIKKNITQTKFAELQQGEIRSTYSRSGGRTSFKQMTGPRRRTVPRYRARSRSMIGR
jgi:ATP-dependent RNA helicase RhlE